MAERIYKEQHTAEEEGQARSVAFHKRCSAGTSARAAIFSDCVLDYVLDATPKQNAREHSEEKNIQDEG